MSTRSPLCSSGYSRLHSLCYHHHKLSRTLLRCHHFHRKLGFLGPPPLHRLYYKHRPIPLDLAEGTAAVPVGCVLVIAGLTPVGFKESVAAVSDDDSRGAG